MTDRYFENTLPDYSPEEEGKDSTVECKSPLAFDRTVGRPSRQCVISTAEFLEAALRLKDEIVRATWSPIARVSDPTTYTGLLGTAFLCFKTYQVTGGNNELVLCTDIINSCAAAAEKMEKYVTFLCGQPGIYALGAAVAKCRGDQQRLQYYLDRFLEVGNRRALSVGPEEGGLGMPYELLYGRAGFVWSALFVNKYVGAETIPWSKLEPVIRAVLAAGRAGASHTSCPLMYQWHGTRYWGAAHGLAGIMHVLLYFHLGEEDAVDVKGTLRYMIKNRLPSGNYPSSEGNPRDRLVHWCHGAPGVCLALCKAAEVFPLEDDFQQAAIEAAEVVWKRGLLRRVGICHGVSGNAYPFLALYRLLGAKKYLHRAREFAGFLHDNGRKLIAQGKMHGGDHPYSLFEGLAGTAHLWLDMVDPQNSRFPGFEL
ncbi:hypothetical protein O6H91_20G020600 [Diphasiastrum complanatum]|uniref:Uncharacterized protein n=1 Tax=Diphasiastrum complanatum TaxID=34168 RepID=A0ACC2AN76_DIPCM|nr:hypothetical protein O6H91_20G020600 [Diphasiastrum complanatum]